MHFNFIDWHVTPFRAERWYELWRPAAARTLAFGATSWSLTRSEDDPQLIRQITVWNDRGDFERWWNSDEIMAVREDAINYYGKPVYPQWHLFADGERAPEAPSVAATE